MTSRREICMTFYAKLGDNIQNSGLSLGIYICNYFVKSQDIEGGFYLSGALMGHFREEEICMYLLAWLNYFNRNILSKKCFIKTPVKLRIPVCISRLLWELSKMQMIGLIVERWCLFKPKKVGLSLLSLQGDNNRSGKKCKVLPLWRKYVKSTFRSYLITFPQRN